MTAPKVFSIHSGVRFLPTLVDALLEGRLVGAIGSDPLALARTTIYLPTQRAARALSAVLAARRSAALLPRMIPLGEVDEAEFALAASPLFDGAADALRPPMPPLQRRLILARLVQRWAGEVDRTLLRIDADVPFLVPSSPADAIALAGDLERLMDALTVEGVPWSEIASAVEAEQSRFFALTLDFLRIAAENWPSILEERAVSDPVVRARLLLLAEADRLRRERPADPVVVAGSTGSRLPTAALIATVASLPRGAVVLPGLDTDLDAEGWDAIEPRESPDRVVVHGHPQAVLHNLLGPRCLRLLRRDVIELGAPDIRAIARTRVLSQALRPAETTDAWARVDPAARADMARDGLSGLAVAETADEREEALVAAIALRETLETPEATAVLVTPDRGLAMRVAAELGRWGIAIEDSAGTNFARSQAGRFARLTAELAIDVRPARVIALLSHPFVRLGLPRSDVVRGAAALEIGALRGLKPRPGFAGIRAALEARRIAKTRKPRPQRRLKPVDWDLAAAILDRLEAAFRDFACAGAACNLVALAGRHRATCDRLLAGADQAVDDDPSLACLDALFDDLELARDDVLPGSTADYPAFFTSLTRERFVANHAAAHPRMRILGLLEARLLDVDRVVLGGLDEGVWPMRTTTDAFLNRPMRDAVGLNPPERRIGQSAHDFVQALGCRDAVITRAAKREGAPTVPSRFLQRIKAFAGEASWASAIAAGERLRGYAAALDAGLEPVPPRLTQPKPKADPALFPRKLSVTEIETLVRDPYSIFARHVLGLDPLDAVALVPGASDRGTLIHDVLGKFAAAYPGQIADLAAAQSGLGQLAEEAFAWIRTDHPEIYAEWFPRYERLAAAFFAWEQARRPEIALVHAEIRGEHELKLGAERITLTGLADRIEACADGSFRILDFKTGKPPTSKEVFVGFSPQLTLEAAMLMEGAFKDLKASTTPELIYIHASGGRTPFEPMPVIPPKGDERTIEAIVANHYSRLRGLIARFLTGEAPYTSRPYAQYASRFGAYDHLARVLEWSLADAPEPE